MSGCGDHIARHHRPHARRAHACADDPRHEEAWFNLANALAAQKRFAEALEAARQAVARVEPLLFPAETIH